MRGIIKFAYQSDSQFSTFLLWEPLAFWGIYNVTNRKEEKNYCLCYRKWYGEEWNKVQQDALGLWRLIHITRVRSFWDAAWKLILKYLHRPANLSVQSHCRWLTLCYPSQSCLTSVQRREKSFITVIIINILHWVIICFLHWKNNYWFCNYILYLKNWCSLTGFLKTGTCMRELG